MKSKHPLPPKMAYSIKEASHASSLSRSSIYNAINSGSLKARRLGGRTVILADSLHAFIAGEG